MEATAIIRNSFESWRSGAVRWFLGHVSDHVARQSEPQELFEGRVSRGEGQANRWQDAFWSSHGSSLPVKSRKRQVMWQEQRELWPANERAVEAPTAAEPASVSRAEAPRIERAASPVSRLVRAARVKPMSYEPAPKRRTRAVRTAEMARLLQVTGAVDGVMAGQRFALPRKAFSADMSSSLWKERPMGTPFVTGC